jgi:hypothetical protein
MNPAPSDVAISVTCSGDRPALGVGSSTVASCHGDGAQEVFLTAPRLITTISYMSYPNRRDTDRIPLSIFLDEYVDDRHQRALTNNVSPTGIYVHRVLGAGKRRLPFGRQHRHVQLAFALPGTGDTIWARGEIRHDDLGLDLVHGTGIELTDMARAHQRLLRDFVYEHRRQRLEQILALIRRNRYH